VLRCCCDVWEDGSRLNLDGAATPQPRATAAPGHMLPPPRPGHAPPPLRRFLNRSRTELRLPRPPPPCGVAAMAWCSCDMENLTGVFSPWCYNRRVLLLFLVYIFASLEGIFCYNCSAVTVTGGLRQIFLLQCYNSINFLLRRLRRGLRQNHFARKKLLQCFNSTKKML
jgi:hypothetical protein